MGKHYLVLVAFREENWEGFYSLMGSKSLAYVVERGNALSVLAGLKCVIAMCVLIGFKIFKVFSYKIFYLFHQLMRFQDGSLSLQVLLAVQQ